MQTSGSVLMFTVLPPEIEMQSGIFNKYRHSTSALFMASRSNISSDPECLLSLIDVLPAESDTDNNFDRYLEEDESFVAQHVSPHLRESTSLDSPTDPALLTESPLLDRIPFPTPI